MSAFLCGYDIILPSESKQDFYYIYLYVGFSRKITQNKLYFIITLFNLSIYVFESFLEIHNLFIHKLCMIEYPYNHIFEERYEIRISDRTFSYIPVFSGNDHCHHVYAEKILREDRFKPSCSLRIT